MDKCFRFLGEAKLRTGPSPFFRSRIVEREDKRSRYFYAQQASFYFKANLYVTELKLLTMNHADHAINKIAALLRPAVFFRKGIAQSCSFVKPLLPVLVPDVFDG